MPSIFAVNCAPHLLFSLEIIRRSISSLAERWLSSLRASLFDTVVVVAVVVVVVSYSIYILEIIKNAYIQQYSRYSTYLSTLQFNTYKAIDLLVAVYLSEEILVSEVGEELYSLLQVLLDLQVGQLLG